MNIKKSCENCDNFTKGSDECYCNFSWSEVKCKNFDKWEPKHLYNCDIYQPNFNKCKWIFEFNNEVGITLSINSKVLSNLLQRIEILERKLAEYERNTRKPH